MASQQWTRVVHYRRWYVAESVHYESDGRLAVCALDDQTLKVVDVTGKQYTLKGHAGAVSDVAVNADGQLAVSASDDQTLKVWDVSSGRYLITFAGATQIHCCAISSDGHTIIAGDAAGAVHFIDWMRYDNSESPK